MRSNSKIKVSELNRSQEECYKAWQVFNTLYDVKEKVPDAVWDTIIQLPEPPSDPRKIANWGKSKKDRKFPVFGNAYTSRMEAYYTDYDDNTPEYNEYLKFIDKEYEKRYNGFWFFNGDDLVYVTDRHYMFLQYWKIPVTTGRRKKRALPKYKDAQRDYHYCLWAARKDPTSAGVVFTSARRWGKTAIANSDGYWDTTENSDSRYAIQSKTDKDAKKVFNKIVRSWQALPAFWRPVDTGDSTVSTILRFSQPKKKNTKSQIKEYEDVLNSEIFYEVRGEEALDGDYASYILHDEAGKLPKHVDCDERWNIARECLVDNGKIIGFGIVTTTVEDMEKYGSALYLKLWRRSNPNERMPDGKTDSYLYRVFFPCYYGFEGDEDIQESFVDEWGNTDIVRAKAFFTTMYAAKDGDLSYARKYPITIDDAFSLREDFNTYNQRKLKQQIEYAKELDPIAQPVTGNFMWKDGLKDGEVVFHPNPDGRWKVAWMPPEEDRNRKEFADGHWKPTRDYCKTGADPFAHAATTEKGSDAATYTILESHYQFPKMKMAWVCQYLARPPHPDEAAEDMIMQCVFYSSFYLSEKNIYGALQHFKTRGYDHYCLFNPLDPDSITKRAKGLRGMPMTGVDAGEALSNITQAHIEDHIGFNQETQSYGFCPFIELLENWQKFNPQKRTEFDAAMAAGMTLIACMKPKYKVEEGFKPSDWLPNWDNSGGNSNRRN